MHLDTEHIYSELLPLNAPYGLFYLPAFIEALFTALSMGVGGLEIFVKYISCVAVMYISNGYTDFFYQTFFFVRALNLCVC